MKVHKKKFGIKDNQPVYLFTMENNHGLEVSCLNYGCIITKILAPDRKGNVENVVLGFDNFTDYEVNSPYLGAIVGRFAGRISEGAFQLDGNNYKVAQNEGINHLHGGIKGFSHVLWDAEIIEKEHELSLIFYYNSPDGEEGYPGNVEMKVTYTLNNDNEFMISYYGVSDKTTLLNVTNHTYFNLSGNLKRDILKHELTIDSDAFLELQENLLPTGNIINVENTVFDFRNGREIGEGVKSNNPQNIIAHNGYDHPFLLNKNHQQEIIVVEKESGRKLIVETDEPCVVLYTGNNLGNELSFYGTASRNYLGLCLETQHPPDSINHPQFQSSILQEKQVYQTKTKYLFTIESM